MATKPTKTGTDKKAAALHSLLQKALDTIHMPKEQQLNVCRNLIEGDVSAFLPPIPAPFVYEPPAPPKDSKEAMERMFPGMGSLMHDIFEKLQAFVSAESNRKAEYAKLDRPTALMTMAHQIDHLCYGDLAVDQDVIAKSRAIRAVIIDELHEIFVPLLAADELIPPQH